LMRLLAKLSLTLADIPEIKRLHEVYEAAANQTSSAPDTGPEPHALEVVHRLLWDWTDVQPHEYVAFTLWILHLHVFGHFGITPRLALLSPVPGCGKTNLLKLIQRLAPNATRFANVTAAALFRAIDDGLGTALIDEGDQANLKLDSVMRTLLHDGYDREGVISRTLKGAVREFSIFAPIAIAAIGQPLSPAHLSRSIVANMHWSKRTNLKTKEDFERPEEKNLHEKVRQIIVRWVHSNPDFNKDPELPRILRLRPRDNWKVLISIADSFNDPYWSKAARDAAVAFSAGYHDANACVDLLIDTRTVFTRLNIDRIKSLDLCHRLHELEDGVGVWTAWCGDNDDRPPHNITQGEVATLYRRFDRVGLRPRPLYDLGSKSHGGVAGRGYYYKQLEPWFELYCPQDHTAEVHQLQPKDKAN
jgi:hypothetical protein